MKYHLIICPFYLIQMLWGRAQLFLTNPRTSISYDFEYSYIIINVITKWYFIEYVNRAAKISDISLTGRVRGIDYSCPLINLNTDIPWSMLLQ